MKTLLLSALLLLTVMAQAKQPRPEVLSGAPINRELSTIIKNAYVDNGIVATTSLLEVAAEQAIQSNSVFQLITHGRPGQLLIQNKWMTSKEIATFLRTVISSSITQVNIYGCEFAKGEVGKAAVSYLQSTLGVLIAASDNITGNDGDWILEVGNINCIFLKNLITGNLQFKADDDLDGDGVTNYFDIDDDNDGVLDVVECPVTARTQSNATPNDWIGVTSSTFRRTIMTDGIDLVAEEPVPSSLSVVGAQNNYTIPFTITHSYAVVLVNATPNNAQGTLKFTFSPGIPASELAFAIGDVDYTTVSGRPRATFIINNDNSGNIFSNNFEYYQVGNFPLPNLNNGGVVTFPVATNDSGGPDNPTQSVGVVGTTSTLITSLEIDFLNFTERAYFRILALSPPCDQDMDGVPNNLDLDTDGDGCPDAVEAGVIANIFANGGNYTPGTLVNTPDNIDNAPYAIVGTGDLQDYSANGFYGEIEDNNTRNAVYEDVYTYNKALDPNDKSNCCFAGTVEPTLETGSVRVCAGTLADISNLVTSTSPMGASVVWFDNSAGTGDPIDPTAVPPGTYFAFYHDEVYSCFSPASTQVVVSNFPTPTVNAVSNKSFCPGVLSPVITLGSSVAGATFAWTNDNTTIGLAASGSGDIPAFTTINNTTSAVVAIIRVVPTANGCRGTARVFRITVRPRPAITSSIANQVIYEGSSTTSVVPGSNVAGTTYTWTNSNTNVGLSSANGTGTIPSFIGTNNTTSPIVTTITVTPSASGCLGTPVQFTITVNNLPPFANNDQLLNLDRGTVAVLSILTNDVPSDAALNPMSVSLVRSSIPGATCTVTDTEGDCISVLVPNEGTWSVNPTTGITSFTPLPSFMGNPKILNYTVKDEDGLISNEATITVTYDSPTPAYWLTVSGALINTDALISWKVTEKNVSHYLVQRSLNGEAFTTIGTVQAATTSELIKNYSFTDNTASSLGTPIVAYRLVSVDFDGHLEFSPVVSVTLPMTKSSIGVYPNPSRGSINFTSLKDVKQIEIYNAFGARIKQIPVVNSSVLNYDISTLPSGTYFIKLTNDGKMITHTKLVLIK